MEFFLASAASVIWSSFHEETGLVPVLGAAQCEELVEQRH